MNDQLSLQEWLAQEPLPEEIRYNEDGSSYIPIEYIKPKLDYFCPSWTTKNFNHFLFVAPNGNTFCSASVELFIEYQEYLDGGQCNLIKRTITGSATFDVQRYYPNLNWGATALSLSIVSAAKELGLFFGKELNKEILTVPFNPKKESPKKSQLIKSINKITSDIIKK